MQNIATALFIGLGLIVVFLGWYVFSHKNKPVIIFHPENDRSLSKIMSVLGIVLIICGSLSIISAFTTLMIFKIILLICDAVFVSSLSFLMLAYSIGN